MKSLNKLKQKFISNIENALRNESSRKGYSIQDIAPAMKAVRYCTGFKSFESDMKHERARKYASVPLYTDKAPWTNELYNNNVKDGSMNALHDVEGIREIATVIALLNKYARGIKYKRVLDIGCGIESSEFYKTDGFRPWLARGLSYLGANVTGIDKLESENEPYNHISADLVKNNLQDLLKGKKFDIVIARHFFDSPHLEYSLRLMTDGARKKELDNFIKFGTDLPNIGNKIISFADRLIGEISELTKNKGLFMEKSVSDEGIWKIPARYGFQSLRMDPETRSVDIWRKEKPKKC